MARCTQTPFGGWCWQWRDENEGGDRWTSWQMPVVSGVLAGVAAEPSGVGRDEESILWESLVQTGGQRGADNNQQMLVEKRTTLWDCLLWRGGGGGSSISSSKQVVRKYRIT